MDKEDNYSTPNFAALDYDIDRNHNQHHNHNHHHHHQVSEDHQNGDGLMVNYLLNNLPHQHQPQLSFADVMQFADFGPKLALNQTRISEEGEEGDEAEGDQSGMDPVFFLKFPVLNDKNISVVDQSLVVCHDDLHEGEERFIRAMSGHAKDKEIVIGDGQEHDSSVQLQFLGDQDLDDQKSNDNDNNNNHIGNPSGSHEVANNNSKNKRKRARTVKSTEEVESQRMTHIAVERNRRKQMNEHLRVLRSLMPGSYVQRGDQASIIGGAIEFVRELEQLLQCLESQKRRRLLGSDQTPIRPAGAGPDSGVVSNNAGVLINPQPLGPPFFPPNNIPLPDDMSCFEAAVGGGPREETAESKSCLADVEVKLLGFDAMIKILSRRRPGQLIKAIAALEDLQFNILHTNITTIEQTVLYSFNVKVTSESRFSAEDIASSVQQIFSFIHANSTI